MCTVSFHQWWNMVKWNMPSLQYAQINLVAILVSYSIVLSLLLQGLPLKNNRLLAVLPEPRNFYSHENDRIMFSIKKNFIFLKQFVSIYTWIFICLIIVYSWKKLLFQFICFRIKPTRLVHFMLLKSYFIVFKILERLCTEMS